MIYKKLRRSIKNSLKCVERSVLKLMISNNDYVVNNSNNNNTFSHLPGWFKSLLPKSALTVEEKAWNSYPYTKTQVGPLKKSQKDTQPPIIRADSSISFQ